MPPITPVPVAPPISRRAFLGRLAVLGAAGFTASALVACGGSSGETASDAAAGVEAASCPGYAGLPEPQLQVRQSLGYVDAAPTAEQHCANCRFYVQPAAGVACGGCQLFQGPVSPGGWCRSWAAAPV